MIMGLPRSAEASLVGARQIACAIVMLFLLGWTGYGLTPLLTFFVQRYLLAPT